MNIFKAVKANCQTCSEMGLVGVRGRPTGPSLSSGGRERARTGGLSFLQCWSSIWFSSPLGPDVICRWWTSAIAMAISWLQGDDAAVRTHFTEVERVPQALEVTECVALLDLLPASLQGSPRCQQVPGSLG